MLTTSLPPGAAWNPASSWIRFRGSAAYRMCSLLSPPPAPAAAPSGRCWRGADRRCGRRRGCCCCCCCCCCCWEARELLGAWLLPRVGLPLLPLLPLPSSSPSSCPSLDREGCCSGTITDKLPSVAPRAAHRPTLAVAQGAGSGEPRALQEGRQQGMLVRGSTGPRLIVDEEGAHVANGPRCKTPGRERRREGGRLPAEPSGGPAPDIT